MKCPAIATSLQEAIPRSHVQLNRFTRQSIGIPDYPSLKTTLGIDHPYLVHHWRKAGGIGQARLMSGLMLQLAFVTSVAAAPLISASPDRPAKSGVASARCDSAIWSSDNIMK